MLTKTNSDCESYAKKGLGQNNHVAANLFMSMNVQFLILNV